jgi:hypothetical protein
MFDACPDVHIATPEYFEELYETLMEKVWPEWGHHTPDELLVKDCVWRAVNRQASMVGVVGDHTNIKAFILLRLENMWYNTDVQIIELVNFVVPEYRKTNYAKQLISFAKKCSDELKLDLMVGVISNDRTEAKVRLYKRQLPYVGAFFLHHPKQSEAV